MSNLPIRGIDPDLATTLKQQAQASGKIVNQLVLDVLKEHTGHQNMTEYPPLKVAVELLKTEQPSWLDMFSGFLTPLIAIVTVYIAVQQHRLSKRQFQYESYERRFQVYKTVQCFLSEIVREGKTSYTCLSQFYAEASAAAFLFDPSVQNYTAY